MFFEYAKCRFSQVLQWVCIKLLSFTGVYTKNRNFRLFMSSKLGKKSPLTVSDQNQYMPDKGGNSEEQLFCDSLVANVQ